MLVLFATLGMSIMVSASDFMTLYHRARTQLAVRLTCSLRSCASDQRSAEAGLKYFVLGALASGILLYGMSLLYGFTGATDVRICSRWA